MAGCTGSNGTGIGAFPSLVLFFFCLVQVLVNFPLLCLEQHFFSICRHLEIWISKNLQDSSGWSVFSSAQCGVHHLLVGVVQ